MTAGRDLPRARTTPRLGQTLTDEECRQGIGHPGHPTPIRTRVVRSALAFGPGDQKMIRYIAAVDRRTGRFVRLDRLVTHPNETIAKLVVRRKPG